MNRVLDLGVVLRDATEADMEVVRALNESELPHVSSVTVAEFERYRGEARYFRVAEASDGEFAGFLIGFGPGADYDSVNYLWFAERYERFLYVDRIVVSETARGLGIGRKFYADVADHARDHAPIVTCEVNLQPPNEASHRFHANLGFCEVGRQETDGGKKQVSLLAWDLTETHASA